MHVDAFSFVGCLVCPWTLCGSLFYLSEAFGNQEENFSIPQRIWSMTFILWTILCSRSSISQAVIPGASIHAKRARKLEARWPSPRKSQRLWRLCQWRPTVHDQRRRWNEGFAGTYWRRGGKESLPTNYTRTKFGEHRFPLSFILGCFPRFSRATSFSRWFPPLWERS